MGDLVVGQENQFLVLPPEILIKIMENLGNIAIISLMRTCKNLNDFIKDWLEEHEKRLKCRGLRFSEFPIDGKWTRVFTNEKGIIFCNSENCLAGWDIRKKNSTITYNDDVLRFTHVVHYRGYIITSSYDTFLTVFDNDFNLVTTIGQDIGDYTVVSFSVFDNKVYFCGKLNRIKIYYLDGTYYNSIDTLYCSSNLELSEDGRIIYVVFNKQNCIIAYESDNLSPVARFDLKKFGKITKISTKGNFLYVGLDNGNINVFENLKYQYFVKTFLGPITNILPLGNVFYAISNNSIVLCREKYVKFYLNFIIDADRHYVIDPTNKNLAVVYHSPNPLIGFD